ncbi:SdrD B-like domain-containing protein [Allokutzneria albata]|uniref:SD-repeat containing protein B domain-containing protein n=1 Tax=Allokutzneria albata TaxID=211114 RepID=A0A1G9YWE5_ALLAB|nr:SdrD B-like domain-containing protein [Allokutzneria albata]SDN12666.1 hypothetical protein SAMN04489726_5054 [Allokutzneria albata]
MSNSIRGAGAAALALLSITALAVPATAAPEPTVTGVVWADTDFDGVREPGEAGVADITIAAYRADNTEVASAVTNKAGHYALKLSGGPYKLRPKALAYAKTITRPNVGDDARDSDFAWGTWETAEFSCAPSCPKFDLGLVERKQDIALAVAPAEVSARKGQSFSVELTASNLGTVPNGGDWIEAGFKEGLQVTSATGDGWACRVDPSAGQYLFCRSEADHNPGTDRPKVRVELTPTADSGDITMDFHVAGFRRSESVFPNNAAALRVRVG